MMPLQTLRLNSVSGQCRQILRALFFDSRQNIKFVLLQGLEDPGTGVLIACLPRNIFHVSA